MKNLPHSRIEAENQLRLPAVENEKWPTFLYLISYQRTWGEKRTVYRVFATKQGLTKFLCKMAADRNYSHFKIWHGKITWQHVGRGRLYDDGSIPTWPF